MMRAAPFVLLTALLISQSVACDARSCPPTDYAASTLPDDEESGALHMLQMSAGKQHEANAELGKIRQCGAGRPVQVFVDFDDTYKSSGGFWPAGCEGIYTKEVIFPGMAQFVLELARGPEEALKVLQPAVMSARPDALKFLRVKRESFAAKAMTDQQTREDPAIWDQYNVEMKVQIPTNLTSYSYEAGGVKKLLGSSDSLGEKFGLDVNGSKYGQLTDFVDFDKMGTTKYNSFLDFFNDTVRDHDEACVVWIGDDGQGDCNPAAQKMRKYVKKQQPELGLKVAFIHKLACTTDFTKKPDCQEELADDDGAPLIIFDNYLDAARKAAKRNFISQAGFNRVKTAVEDFYATYCDHEGASKAPDIARQRRLAMLAPETVGTLGCQRLRAAISETSGGKVPDVPRHENRAYRRFEAFCKGCCNDKVPNGESDFPLDGYSFRCHNLYHHSSRWKFKMQASADSCLTHCGLGAMR
eukprot:TRINITY_DN9527_c0_g1_i1.p1 TRINITY_DN9527_c0_g1~~TRINITY_DN9527_c0_g1_i1.p1  ORF type:complete len:470 (-),score=89.67 TRINITY_DN9527_c0_g1_i1:227-1636(-)